MKSRAYVAIPRRRAITVLLQPLSVERFFAEYSESSQCFYDVDSCMRAHSRLAMCRNERKTTQRLGIVAWINLY
jgi:hypothetical protein